MTLVSDFKSADVRGANLLAAEAGLHPWLFGAASNDVDVHCANLGRWRLAYDQIGCGAFNGSFTEVRLPCIQVFREKTSQKVRQYGRLGADSFGIALPWSAPRDV